MSREDIELMAHLLRRAGFGADRAEIERRAASGYEATVEELLDTDAPSGIEDDLVRRYHPDQLVGLGQTGFEAHWLYRMVNSKTPLQEKVALFWHGVFATGYSKLTQGKVLMDQISMFRRLGMGSLRPLLIELSRDPAMIIWLDNYDNHKGAINENYGRELLELFSMGVGNYSESDIKECARAFTGWTVANTEYMTKRAMSDSLWPYGRLNLHFEYRPEDHDDGEVTFLGQKGNFNGEDVVEIICQQKATAKFISRQMYSFFVADEPPVTQWSYSEPRDREAIDMLSRVYFDSGYSTRSMLRALFLSDSFRSEDSRYAKVKGPAGLVAGILKLTGEYHAPNPKLQDDANQMGIMGQTLVNPPSVEGWHEGVEWIETGSLVERVNFASKQFGEASKPGIRAMTDAILGDGDGVVTPERLVDGALDQMGAVSVSDKTRSALLEFAEQGGELRSAPEATDKTAARRVAQMLQLVAATPEFQNE